MPGIKLKFEIQFPALFLHRLASSAGKTKTSINASKKKISRRCMACIFYFRSSINVCNYQPLALANPYHSLCYDFIRLGDGYRLIRQTVKLYYS